MALAAVLSGEEAPEEEEAPPPPVEQPAWLVEPDRVAPPAAPVSPPLGDLAGGGIAVGMPIWNGPTPVPTGQPGMYRSFTAPPAITPSFVWPPVPEPAAGRAGPASTAGTSC